jgi:hypothetical protein
LTARLCSYISTTSGIEEAAEALTALIAWPNFHGQGVRSINIEAAPAETRNAQLASIEIAHRVRMQGWRLGMDNNLVQKKQRTDLIPTGLPMEGDYTQTPENVPKTSPRLLPEFINPTVSKLPVPRLPERLVFGKNCGNLDLLLH